MSDFKERLRAYQESNNVFSKGKLSVVIQLTRIFKEKTFPLVPEDYKTEKEGYGD